jgi:hypothetical protein
MPQSTVSVPVASVSPAMVGATTFVGGAATHPGGGVYGIATEFDHAWPSPVEFVAVTLARTFSPFSSALIRKTGHLHRR